MASVNTLIARMRYWCEVANMGYSQSDRWNFNPAGRQLRLQQPGDPLSQEAGFDYTGTAVNTANLSVNLTSGWKRLPVDGHQAGDILLNDVNHVAVYQGGQLAQASISEHNSLYGTAGT